jgi:hypothetical protein
MARVIDKIQSITSLAELDGYESEARKRGLHPEEVRALHEKRKALTA